VELELGKAQVNERVLGEQLGEVAAVLQHLEKTYQGNLEVGWAILRVLKPICRWCCLCVCALARRRLESRCPGL